MSAQRDGHVILNVNVLGVGQQPAAWQFDDHGPTGLFEAPYWVEIAQLAERGRLDALFLADAPRLEDDPALRPAGNLDPTVIEAVVSQHTEALGLIATATTTYNDPVEWARRTLSLDTVSNGRFAWNVVTTIGDAAGANFGTGPLPDRHERYARASEFVGLVKALWRSASGGPRVTHHGAHFDYEGSLDAPPSPQRQPLIVQAGGSPDGRRLAAGVADFVFSAEMDHEAGRQHYQQVKDLAQDAGRERDAIRILPGLSLILGSTEHEAIELYDDLERRGPHGYGLRRISGFLGPEVFDLPLDRPIPASLLDAAPPADFRASLGFRESFIRFARESGGTLRDVLRGSGGYGHRILIGTPEQAADTIEHWYSTSAADGFNLMPGVFPRDLQIIVDEVVPLLRRRGLFRTEYEDSTLRGRVFGRPFVEPRPLTGD
ncbi:MULTISPECIES: LLM class flavin-dependent oxidoreductase [unclassified Pseudoclavibacter]|uniref:LLM class flavin-dependent oxidoreductase n=1 Tax=unclassified Pseudoclavibacter TaxID=2615177 RepID=UPI001301148C|nr:MULTISPECIES: LLM class flavin-dependent oxidoreductase [unclassified Pseudoclavibacter]KAB1644492.1 LLM class flavin-dependent oxidoreductase [Pseudoclavibacter sp. CFCC 14310]KAB1664004.1 LLM class flavin-dependent oxidoreductase [Pseudoclavibacter sp. CFCC 13611]